MGLKEDLTEHRRAQAAGKGLQAFGSLMLGVLVLFLFAGAAKSCRAEKSHEERLDREERHR